MVTSVTNYSRNGLSDWLIQRVSAVIIAVFALWVLIFALNHPQMSFTDLHGLFTPLWFKIFTVLAVLSILAHAWIGLWIVFTDYVKPVVLRLTLTVLLVLLLLSYLIWAITILWG